MSKLTINGIRIKNNEIQIVTDDNCENWKSMSEIDYITMNEFVTQLINDNEQIIKRMNKDIPENTGIRTSEKQRIVDYGNSDIKIKTENPFVTSSFVYDEDVGFETEKTEDEDAIIGADIDYKIKKKEKRLEKLRRIERNKELERERMEIAKLNHPINVNLMKLKKKSFIKDRDASERSRKRKNKTRLRNDNLYEDSLNEDDYDDEPFREPIFFNRKIKRILNRHVFFEIESPMIKNKVVISLKVKRSQFIKNDQKFEELKNNILLNDDESDDENNHSDKENLDLDNMVRNVTISKNKLHVEELEITEEPINFFNLARNDEDDSSVN
ncbi:hypothetical protein DMUE_0752 [Dictyocoela muelleri]|nr:hypothetical protein DMUE_0752 [Dictyocoela muelleri]